MNAARHSFPHTTAKPASLAERIVAGVFDGLPEWFTNEEWTREAQCALDCEDDTYLLRMVEEGRLQDAHREWQSLGALKGIDRQDIDIEQGPFASAYFSLGGSRG